MTKRMPERTLGDVLRELEAVKQALIATPDDEWARRQDLHDREAALRDELRALGRGQVGQPSIEQVKRQIAVVEQRIKDHFGLRMSYASGGQGGPGGGGIDPQWLHKWHRLMDRSADLKGMRDELRALRAELARFEESSR